jgi:hypothetical protein
LKLLFVVTVLVIFLLVLYWRLRPYLVMAQKMFGIVREVRRMGVNEGGAPPQRAGNTGGKLVRCDSCRTWIPNARALSVRSSNAAYCSQSCIENANVKTPTRKVAG